MRNVYATALEVRADADVTTSLEYVGRWIHDWYRRQGLNVDVLENLATGDLDVTPLEGHKLSARHFVTSEVPDDRLVDVRWQYPDQYDPSLGWVVRLALLRRPQSLLLSIEVAVTGLQMLFAPATIKLGSPRVVRDIARLRSVFLASHPYNVAPEVIGADDMDVLISELVDPGRPYPVVLVSRRLQDDVPLVDSHDLAERLAGVAKVYELADKWTAFRLTEEITKPLSCYAGAVRLYWPRFSDQADPFEHPLWAPWLLKDADATERSLNQLAGFAFDASAFRHVEPAPITLVRLAAEREARMHGRAARTKSIDELLDELIEMEEKLSAAQAENTDLRTDNETLRANAVALTSQSWSPSSQVAAPAQPTPAEEGPISVPEAVAMAEGRAKHVRYLPSAHQSASESPYRHPDRVLQALTALDEVAAIWAETVATGKPAGSIRQLFKKRGFDYADDISQTSKGKWGTEYSADYKGHQLDISPHITLGAKQADTCLSIHWAWLRDENAAIVAHVGRHKTNTKT